MLAPKAVGALSELIDVMYPARARLSAVELILDGIQLREGPAKNPREWSYVDVLVRLRQLRRLDDDPPSSAQAPLGMPPESHPCALASVASQPSGSRTEDPPDAGTECADGGSAAIDLSAPLAELLAQLHRERKLSRALTRVLEVRRFLVKDVWAPVADSLGLTPDAIVRSTTGLRLVLMAVTGVQRRCWRAHHGDCPKVGDPDRTTSCRFWDLGLAEIVRSPWEPGASGGLPQCATDFDLMRLQMIARRIGTESGSRVVPVVVLRTEVAHRDAKRWERRIALWNANLRDEGTRVRLVGLAELLGAPMICTTAAQLLVGHACRHLYSSEVAERTGLRRCLAVEVIFGPEVDAMNSRERMVPLV